MVNGTTNYMPTTTPSSLPQRTQNLLQKNTTEKNVELVHKCGSQQLCMGAARWIYDKEAEEGEAKWAYLPDEVATNEQIKIETLPLKISYKFIIFHLLLM